MFFTHCGSDNSLLTTSSEIFLTIITSHFWNVITKRKNEKLDNIHNDTHKTNPPDIIEYKAPPHDITHVIK